MGSYRGPLISDRVWGNPERFEHRVGHVCRQPWRQQSIPECQEGLEQRRLGYDGWVPDKVAAHRLGLGSSEGAGHPFGVALRFASAGSRVPDLWYDLEASTYEVVEVPTGRISAGPARAVPVAEDCWLCVVQRRLFVLVVDAPPVVAPWRGRTPQDTGRALPTMRNAVKRMRW
jgi:hypothetical protein